MGFRGRGGISLNMAYKWGLAENMVVKGGGGVPKLVFWRFQKIKIFQGKHNPSRPHFVRYPAAGTKP